jgi:hypothetical protein
MKMVTSKEWIPAGVYPREIGGGKDKTSTGSRNFKQFDKSFVDHHTIFLSYDIL